jgi:hypothetical protein
MSDTRFIITTSLEGYINALVPSGKFNNCTIGFKVPDAEVLRSLSWLAAEALTAVD